MKHISFLHFLYGKLILCLVAVLGCQPPAQAPSEGDSTSSLPAGLQQTIDTLIGAVEAFDISTILALYADDFVSGTGRSKDDIGTIFSQLKTNKISLTVEDTEVENLTPVDVRLTTRIRVRYSGRFRNVGEGPVVMTDVLQHALRKDAERWLIYTDQRLASYQEGRYGARSPNVRLEVPDKLPTETSYPVTVNVQREKNTVYQILLGNYPEDPGVLPPPDIVTELPPDGILKIPLLINPQRRNEMVRLTVLAVTRAGEPIGATMISTLVPGTPRQHRSAAQASV